MNRLDVDLLEQLLLSLGKTELAIEQSLAVLRASARTATDRGDFATADDACDTYERARKSLAERRRRITDVEVKLYSLRRRLQKR